jgi:hypothetical protein
MKQHGFMKLGYVLGVDSRRKLSIVLFIGEVVYSDKGHDYFPCFWWASCLMAPMADKTR